MSSFAKWLEDVSVRDTAVRATLRRSLTFEPGEFPPAYPYVEPFVGAASSDWRRWALYLVAGLWAAHWRDGRGAPQVTLARAAALHQMSERGSSSTERRFVNLLDADADQLRNRLRQMIALLHDQRIDFDLLLSGVTCWKDERKRPQQQWAREFYRELNQSGAVEETSSEKPHREHFSGNPCSSELRTVESEPR